MLQALHIDVAKVDQDAAHVIMDIHICLKRMFQMFHLFQKNVAIVLSGCCKSRSRCCIYEHTCCKHMFQVFSGVSYVCLQVFHCMLYMFAMVSSVFMCFFKCFRNMFQAFHLSLDVCYKCFV